MPKVTHLRVGGWMGGGAGFGGQAQDSARELGLPEQGAPVLPAFHLDALWMPGLGLCCCVASFPASLSPLTKKV